MAPWPPAGLTPALILELEVGCKSWEHELGSALCCTPVLNPSSGGET